MSVGRIITDTTWRAIGPLGNLEGKSITSVGLSWEVANPGWNTSLTFDDTSAAGWKSAVAPMSPHIWVNGNGWNGSTPSYYRKIFDLVGTPISGLLSFQVDDDAIIYINGQLVSSDTNGVKTTRTGIDVMSSLVQGMNLIAAKAHDSYGEVEYLTVRLDTETVPTPTPAPGAILLGTIGVGVVGWLRRRKRL
jgi:hypothetical protein